MAMSTAHSRGYLQFVPAVEYDTGKRPSVSINRDGIVVVVHNSRGWTNDLWYRLGQVSGGKINWWNSTEAGINRYDFGIYPHVSMNCEGVVVEVHQSQIFCTLWYHVGDVNTQEVNTQARTVTWGVSHEYEKGDTPAIALGNDGTVIEVHRRSCSLYYLVGTVDAANKLINWLPPQQFGEGKFPSVTFNKEGVVVVMYESKRKEVSYCVGKLSEQIITWGVSQQYGMGVSPYVAINGSKEVIAVHESDGIVRDLQCNTGEVDIETKMISWSEETSRKYGRGITPSIATNDDGSEIVEVHETERLFHSDLWYHTGAFKTE